MRGPCPHFRMGLVLVALVASAGALAAPKQPAGDRWTCQGADGTFVSSHALEAEARASCQDRAQAAAGGIFIVVPTGAAGVSVPSPSPVIAKSPTCTVPGPCAANLPLTGRRGSWSWVPPTQLEKGNIVTDLARFEMYRQAFGGKPEQVAEINPKVTNLFWGMDTRDANACFWIQAVRVNSAPMPSDRSNKICMDANGQPLPQA